MSRLVSLSLAVVMVLPLFAQHLTARVDVFPPLLPVEAGETKVIGTTFGSTNVDAATELRVRYEIKGDGVIERIENGANWQCTIEGSVAECTNPPRNRTEPLNVVVRVGSDNGSSVEFKATGAAGPRNAPLAGSEENATLLFYFTPVVDTVADSGPGSLRAAIEQANASTRPTKIVFRLPPPVPAEGWFTLVPASPLPPITGARVFVDGKSQTRFTGDTNTRGPEIAIDGRLAHRGVEIHSRCLARVEGLAIGNFDANQGLWFTQNRPCEALVPYLDHREVIDNYIGTDPTGTAAWPNRRGVRGDFGHGTLRNNVISGNMYSGIWIWAATDQYESFTIEGNRIGTAADGIAPLPNGAAGMLFGDRVAADVRKNIIANHPGMGIALARGETYVQIRQNSMRDNGGIGIDWGVDGTSPRLDDKQVSAPNAPSLLSARYEEHTNRTYFTVVSTSALFISPYYYIPVLDFYANRGADGDGEQWIDRDHDLPLNAEGTFEVWVPGDLRGKWVNATLTRSPQTDFAARAPRLGGELVTLGDESTSEFSNAILVP